MTADGIIISPSIASANQLCLADELKRVHGQDCKDVHIDIEDGNFIPNITFGQKTINALRSATDLPFSYHLMTTHWKEWLSVAADTNASVVFAHLEALDYPRAFIFEAKKLGIQAGLALNPKTALAGAEYLISDLDAVLILTVEPDGAGEPFLPDMLKKAAYARSLSPDIEIWVDGAIKFDMLDTLRENGVTHAVMGREFFK